MGIPAMHDLNMMAALCQLVGKLVNENTISPKVERRLKCGHHAKSHQGSFPGQHLRWIPCLVARRLIAGA